MYFQTFFPQTSKLVSPKQLHCCILPIKSIKTLKINCFVFCMFFKAWWAVPKFGPPVGGEGICRGPTRAGGRAVDLGGPSVYQGSQSLKLSTKAAVFKRVSLLIGRGKACRLGSQAPLFSPLVPVLGPIVLLYKTYS